jgi:hypothetical protein
MLQCVFEINIKPFLYICVCDFNFWVYTVQNVENFPVFWQTLQMPSSGFMTLGRGVFSSLYMDLTVDGESDDVLIG